jgi:hypothetical protein
MTSGWKKIEGQQFRLFGISHRKPVRHDDGMVYQNQRRNIPESNQLTKLAARARENGFYARVLPLPADTILGRQRWGLYLRPKEKYSWDSRFNGTGFDEGVAKELDRPKEWSADVLSRNKRREGQLKNWRAGRNNAFSEMRQKFNKAEKAFTAHWGTKEDQLNWPSQKPTKSDMRLNSKYAEKNEDAIDSINAYMTMREVGWGGINDHQGKEMRQPSGLSVYWDNSSRARLSPSTMVAPVTKDYDPTSHGQGWQPDMVVPSTVGAIIYDRALKDARKRQ